MSEAVLSLTPLGTKKKPPQPPPYGLFTAVLRVCVRRAADAEVSRDNVRFNVRFFRLRCRSLQCRAACSGHGLWKDCECEGECARVCVCVFLQAQNVSL